MQNTHSEEKAQEILLNLKHLLYDHPFYLVYLVCDPLSGNGCGSPNQIKF